MDYDHFQKEVMEIDQNIRFAVVLNQSGKRVCGGYREHLEGFLTEDELSMVLFHAGQRWEGRKHLSHKIGNAKYSMTEYEKVKRISFPIDDKHLLLISTEIEADHVKIIQNVLNLIKSNFQ